jgi:aromatic-amino-acid transaminase
MTLFAAVEMAPRDPILGLTEQFAADPRPDKVNLGVGVYLDENGRIPLLACVAAAERELMGQATPRGYLPIDGMAAFARAARDLVFGTASPVVASGRVATVQALGGTGALKIGADFLRRADPQAKVLISDPSWENHRALFGNAGFVVETYPYYDSASRGVRFEAMLQALAAAPAGTIVVLHACCHNPTGCDLDPSQWSRVVRLMRERALVPFVDLAYQGFGEGLAEDELAVREFLAAGMEFLVSSSFSKNFSLYGERVGALSVVCAGKDDAARVLSQLKIVVRTNYSNPPTHGARVVTTVLENHDLRRQWEEELAGMRTRIRVMRRLLAEGLEAAGVAVDTGFIQRQRGMFSYSGLGAAQMHRLRSEFGVYGVDSGRICVAALNRRNLPHVIESIGAVMKA